MVWLVQGVRDPQRPMEIREGILTLVAERMLHKMRVVVAELALPGGPLEAAATATLAALDGSLPVERVKLLLASRDPALRSVGVRYARDTAAEGRLRSLVRVDPDPEVRIAALDALVEWRGLRAFGDVEPALFDADPAVRARAARAIGDLGAETVPRLQELVERGSHEDAVGPIAALRFSGAAGTLALREIAASHSDERVRTLARIALGQGLGRH
jgi:HEAT repeat protein